MKKFLALVLALVMTMSLVTIGANAAATDLDYTDAPAITNVEAVEILSGIGVLAGYADGSFRPQAPLSRGAGAKLVAYLVLGQDAADKLTATYTVFSDVDDTVGLAAYIEWAAAQHIVDGYGNGKFGPRDTLTEYAFGKMLLTALGYSSEKEGFTGAGWQKNVYSIAVKNGIYDGTESFGACTRDTAARMELGALLSNVVVYGDSVINGKYYWNGNEVTVHPTAGIVKDTAIETGKTLANFYGLKYQDGNDIFGRPGHEWSYGSTWSKFYMDAPVAEYTTAVDVCDVLVDVGIAKNSTKSAAVAEFWTDGAEDEDREDSYSHVATSGSRECVGSFGGQGVLTQVFRLANGEYVITEIDTFLAYVNDVKDSSHGKSSVTELVVYYTDDNNGVAENANSTITINSNIGYAKGDYILVNISLDNDTDELETYDAFVPVSNEKGYDYVVVRGTPSVIDGGVFSGVASDKSQATVDGVRKNINVEYSLSASHLAYRKNESNKYDFFVDQYGNLIGDVKVAPAPYYYGVITDLAWVTGDVSVTPYASLALVDADGNAQIGVAATYNGVAPKAITTRGAKGDPSVPSVAQDKNLNGKYYADSENAMLGVVKYEVNGDQYDLTNVAEEDDGNTAVYAKGAVIAQGNPNIKDHNSNVIAKADENTVFLIRKSVSPSESVYESITGISNVPSISRATIVAVTEGDDSTATFVYVDARNAILANSTVYAFVTSTQLKYTESGVVYEYEVYVNGVKTTIQVDLTISDGDNLFSDGAGTYKLTFNDEGKVTSAVKQGSDNGWTTKVDTIKVTDGSTVMMIGTDAFNIKNAQIFKAEYSADLDGTPAPSDVTNVKAIESLSEIGGATKIVYKLSSSYEIELAFVYVPVEG